MIVSTTSTVQGDRFVSSMNWKGYLALLEAFDERRVRITYDRGRVELLSPSRKHERVKTLLGQMVEFVCFEKEVDFCGLGSTTYKDQTIERGFEPDECYLFSPRLEELDGLEEPETPSPDLAIEVEISASALDRLDIFAKFEVPEVWRYTNKDTLIILALEGGEYREATRSRFLPFLPPAQIAEFVCKGLESTNSRLWLKEIQEWLREHP